MRVLVDTDIFCKLGVCSLLEDAVSLLGATVGDCGRLPALPQMLRRGLIPKRYGKESCERLVPLAQSLPLAPEPSARLLDQMTPLAEIDAGEAQLMAAAIEHDLLLITGDSRALGRIRTIEALVEPLAGRIVTTEAMVLALTDQLGVQTVRQRVRPLIAIDKSMGVWFSPGNPDPVEALVSYHRSLTAELAPLVLWTPPGRSLR